ncbi:MAG: hypothetical protein HYV77_01340 [Candidatus Wildermuthbacteria bacterium]|nr:hypothetical protein [Candidatus Wildermuthbacteria bacterium]
MRAENTAFEGKIIDENIIFEIINLSTKSVFIKYAFLLNQKNERLLISPEMFWGTDGEMAAEDTTELDSDRMFEVIYDRKEVANLGGKTFIVEEETGKQFSINFDASKLRPATYTVSMRNG